MFPEGRDVDMPELTIGTRTARLPIIQGGMAVRISQAPLAAAVASAGGIGLIAGSGMTIDELRDQIRSAHDMTSGVFGVNIMVAARVFKDLVRAAMEEGVDLVVAGAGFSRDLFSWGKEFGVAVVPIVSSARLAQLSERFGAAAVIVEGVEAGGHLGTDRPMEELVHEVVEAVDLPVIGAGGICDGYDIKRVLDMGAAGVQMGSRFACTVECSAPDEFKQMYIDATEEDIVLVESPVGLPGRGLRSPLQERLVRHEYPPIEECQSCLKQCHQQYCIIDALVKTQTGDLENGLVFAGCSAARVHDVLPVAELMEQLEAQWRDAEGGGVA